MKTFVVYVEKLIKVSYTVQAESDKKAKELYYKGKAGKGEEYEWEDQRVEVEEYED